MKKDYRGPIYPSLSFPDINILHKYKTMTKTKKLTLT